MDGGARARGSELGGVRADSVGGVEFMHTLPLGNTTSGTRRVIRMYRMVVAVGGGGLAGRVGRT